ncbi:MAG: hypothetical protein WBK43_05480 [Prolixibacteraceae bacterium]|nr:hypothetical protein [Prolixibacteraceae bacterium]MDI9563230.1 hypothetical protein [Bacteroidota bacterium]NLS99312.1 hypothetical protein [Bacteroidales bacterium]OQB81120.1 MAG: hypothetical protein BWX87_00905 [Bacteroidetes bacterium ADurb.Bin123]HNZ68570.1 hypothetical protein [Prolixibacteraceae bacterium]
MSPSRWSSRSGLSMAFLLLPALALMLGVAPRVQAQCLSAINPVGGSSNLLVLEKNTLRVISFYRYHYGNRYFEGSNPSDYDVISRAGYNYAGLILAYGLTRGITLENEQGYFINKTQHYRGTSDFLRGNGFASTVFSLRGSILKNDIDRFFISGSAGARIPYTREKQVKNGTVLPIELQPSYGAFGGVLQLYVVKEYTETGTRYFFTGRMESSLENRYDERQGNALFTSLFWSKHLMFPWLKGDWTSIVQLRSEIRGKDRTPLGVKASSGSYLFFLSPQLNSYIREKWNVSVILDIPLYQYFHGTQLATRYGISVNLARDFSL